MFHSFWVAQGSFLSFRLVRISFWLGRPFVAFLSAWSSMVRFFPFGFVIHCFFPFRHGHPFFVVHGSFLSFRFCHSISSFLLARSSIFRFFPFGFVIHLSVLSFQLGHTFFVSFLSAQLFMIHFFSLGWFVLSFGWIVHYSFHFFRVGHPSFFSFLSARSSIFCFIPFGSPKDHFFPFDWFVFPFGWVVRSLLSFRLGHPWLVSFLSVLSFIVFSPFGMVIHFSFLSFQLGRPWLISFHSAEAPFDWLAWGSLSAGSSEISFSYLSKAPFSWLI